MFLLLWLLAVVLVCAGVYYLLVKKDLVIGIILIVVGLLVGPGGVSLFNVNR